MKFCPECGSKLPKGIGKSYSICGANTTSDTKIALPQQPIEYTQLQQGPQSSSIDELGKENEMKGEFQNITLSSLLDLLQKTIEEMLKNKEYFRGQTVVESTKYSELRFVDIMKPSPLLSMISKKPPPLLSMISKKPPLVSTNLSLIIIVLNHLWVIPSFFFSKLLTTTTYITEYIVMR